MSDDMIDLARRAVASPHFRPMRGMVGIDGTVILSTSPLVETSEIVEWRYGGTMRRENRECTWSDLRDGGWLPDLREPATLGCVLGLLREVWGCPVWLSLDADPDPLDGEETVVCGSERWTACRVGWGLGAQPCGSGSTEDAALVDALEAAPTPEEK